MTNQAIASDIFDFAELLVSHNVIQDAKSLYDVAGKLQQSKNKSNWGYECGNLKFSVTGRIASAIPQQIELVEIIFSISIAGTFSNEYNPCRNPLVNLNFDIEIEGFDDQVNNYYSAWHLDKHLDNANNNQTKYVHPEYHLTFGGNKLEEKGPIFGSALILPSPRIVSPPMDAILGIDFIVQNYFPLSEISNLINDSRYKEILSNSQRRLWKPYYLSLSAAWNDIADMSFDTGFEHFNLNPHIHKANN